MSAQRLRRWAAIVYMLYKCFVFTGLSVLGHLLTYTIPESTQSWLAPVCVLICEHIHHYLVF